MGRRASMQPLRACSGSGIQVRSLRGARTVQETLPEIVEGIDHVGLPLVDPQVKHTIRVLHMIGVAHPSIRQSAQKELGDRLPRAWRAGRMGCIGEPSRERIMAAENCGKIVSSGVERRATASADHGICKRIGKETQCHAEGRCQEHGSAVSAELAHRTGPLVNGDKRSDPMIRQDGPIEKQAVIMQCRIPL